MALSRKTTVTLVTIAIGFALYASKLYGYLLFHSVTELFSIVIAAGIFVVAWNTRTYRPNPYILFIGIASLFIASIDLLHTLAYKGMGVFPGANANLPTQLWIAGRYLLGISLLVAPYFIGKKLRIIPVCIVYTVVLVALVFSIFFGFFPDAFIEGKGLTPFKILSEFVISLIVVLAILYLWKKRNTFEKPVVALLIWSMLTTIASEMAFTLYSDVYGLFNLLGHYLKVISYYLIYVALIKTNLKRPYEAMVVEIDERKRAEEELHIYREQLEELVKNRTEDLERSQAALQSLLEDVNEANKKLEQANEKLKEVDRLKSMFIASMSHELRTPLNSVIGFSSILLNEWIGTLNDEQKKSLTSILRSGKHLLSLINDVIDVSKIEAGMIEVSREDFDLADLLTEVEQTFAKDAQERKLSLSVQQLSMPMSTDRRRLLQCLLNLVSNAIKYTEKGEITVAISYDERKRDVIIAVTDSGIGIGAEDQAKLFKAFSRIQSHLTSTVPGTGLGLYLTQKIIGEILHGEISVTSEPGKGSTFVIIVPRQLEVEQKEQQVPVITGEKP